MPELPDVEVFRKYMDSTSLHQRIVEVEVRADAVLGETTPQQLKEKVLNHQFSATRRHGKHLFAGLEDGGWLMLHFGMTGFLKYFKDQEESSDHVRILFRFENDYNLAYDCQRKLGRVEPIDRPETFINEQELGPDVLSEGFDFNQFQKLLEGSRAMVKSALMDQNTMAGLGNVYSDEALFDAGIHPRTKVSDVSEEDLRKLYASIKDVLTTAIDSQVDPDKMAEFLLTHREEGSECPRCQGGIAKTKVSGRGTYFCPRCQPAPN